MTEKTYAVDIKFKSIDEQVVEDFIEEYLAPSLSLLGMNMGWDLKTALTGEGLTIEAKKSDIDWDNPETLRSQLETKFAALTSNTNS